MVAEDRRGPYRRLDSPGLIDFGNWQVSLRDAILEYLRGDPHHSKPDNDRLRDVRPAKAIECADENKGCTLAKSVT